MVPAELTMHAEDPMDPELTVLVVNYNSKHVLTRMMSSLHAAAKGIRMQLIIVDNASRDDSAKFIAESWPEATLIANPLNLGFGRANNQALTLLRGDFVLLLNPDAFMAEDALRAALTEMHDFPKCAVLGAKIVESDSPQAWIAPSARSFPTPWNVFVQRTGTQRFFPRTRLIDDPAWDARHSGECDWVPGAFFLVRKAAIDALGFFDPRYFLYSEEVDFCRKVKAAGWTVRYCASAQVAHIGGESAKSDANLSTVGRQISVLQIESELLYYRKHYGFSGLLAAAALGLLADVLVATKRVLRRPGGGEVHFAWSRHALPLLLKTRLGTKPTR